MNGNATFTITFGDQAENHVGMQKLGNKEEAGQGFNLDDLKQAQNYFNECNIECEIIDLKYLLDEKDRDKADEAFVLLVYKGLDAIIESSDGNGSDSFFEEQDKLSKDKKAFMYGRVVNKHARYNLCFSEESQEPNYEEGRGTIVSFDRVPLLNHLRNTLPKLLGNKALNLVAEGNYYYDVSKCGIGFHGDSERTKVVAVRVGAYMPLEYQWFFKNNPVGKRGRLTLGHGDIYVMSEKAVGSDWKKKNILTLRHAAGCDKFLQ